MVQIGGGQDDYNVSKGNVLYIMIIVEDVMTYTAREEVWVSACVCECAMRHQW